MYLSVEMIVTTVGSTKLEACQVEVVDKLSIFFFRKIKIICGLYSGLEANNTFLIYLSN